ncbi:MAG: multifunctional oxoglutarate decarboxylase/oxoglutarate dehydrogenase thiamine pyrophosphate-binding subunit/dihydrolipoyllysine-residue succinyltransferase subunit [Acidimicrobiales bacterium]
MAEERGAPPVVGPNEWLVDEMYEQYLENPRSVSESWQEFFADYRKDRAAAEPAPASAPAPAPAPAPPEPEAEAEREPEPAPQHAPEPQKEAPVAASPDRPRPEVVDTTPPAAATAVAAEAPEGEVLRGAAARIVANMEASLSVPTATSFREVPAKLLEVNRKVINGYLGRKGIGKISFTHLIGYAVVRAVADSMPVMNSTFKLGDDGKPRVVRNPRVNLGLAVDVEKSDGSRTLLVPVIKNADTLDFRGFWLGYEDLIRKVRSNKLSPDDFAGTTITLTNPGTIGTRQSVPRLMPNQGCIVGVGSIDYPAAYQGADPAALADFGVSKVVTLTSTYDHRVIQGAESGLFLQRVHQLLLGEDGFYDQIFRALGVPYEAVKWRRDINPVDREQAMLSKQAAVDTLIRVSRVRGHLIADLDPLAWKEPHMEPELDPATYGLTIWDLDREFLTGGLGGTERLPLGEILRILRDAYCRTIGIEYMHIQELEEQRWIQEQVEGVRGDLSREDKLHILAKLNAAEAFETFLGTKYIGQKRFGLEGGESAIPILDAILEAASDGSLDGVVMGMSHRGRLNVLANIVGKSYDQIFREFEGAIDPDSVQGSGDVKYHLGQTGKFVSRAGNEIQVELSANPSHLEAVDPVVVGTARAKQDLIDRPESFSVLPLLLHGDSAFAGQGVVAETLQLGKIKGYRVGGTVHLVINNQLGFTTPPESARSSEYSTDIAKMVQAPILHVNADDPEACVRVARLAFAYRQRFHKDVVIDMTCYRRLGHNEGDDPSYTQPLMYKRIEAKRSARKLYTEALVKRGDISVEEAEKALADFQRRLQDALEQTRQTGVTKDVKAREPVLIGCLPRIETGVDRSVLAHVYEVMSTPPEGFTIHPKLAKQFEARTKMWRDEGEVDWALGEAMAFGSLLIDGIDIRIAGQDTRRGTFSQRHSVIVDYETGREWVPLAHLDPDQGKFWIYDSLLSEYAALGFEYGYSIVHKDALVAWEAQFGDFVNGAQITIDQYVVAAEDKWGTTSGLVMLLPHGYEGQGPEHSSARIERFLTACAEDNIQVCNCTTAGQYFHLLRRQMHRDVRKPLVVFSPKSLLRVKPARSKVEELTTGSFLEVLGDPGRPDPEVVTRIVLASGKVAVDAIARRDKDGAPVAVLRVEQLYPWPYEYVAEEVARYPNAKQLVWLQEEPENMGPWNFVKGRLYEALGDSYTIRRASRFESGSPATGSHGIHVQEQEQLMEEALGGL